MVLKKLAKLCDVPLRKKFQVDVVKLHIYILTTLRKALEKSENKNISTDTLMELAELV